MSDGIFQKSLQDLVKGIRSHKKDPSVFISQQIAEIKTELRTTDPFLKAEAVRKLTYLQMLGYNVSWASFAIVEVMSQPRFAHKRVGYLAANQSFSESTDVLLLTTNLFKKEFGSSTTNQYEIGLAVNCLANIANKDLARDCMSDLVQLMNHSRPYVRKKAVLGMFKLYVRYPQGLRLTFEKLKERLDDSESSVISTAVNVICELSNKNPRNYLAMAPKFFRLLTTSSNNWMLIKVVKLLGSLVSEEPRLARKLLEPLATIIQNTGAKSLQYECIHTITEALPYTRRDDGTDAKSAPAVIKLCSDYLRGFIEESDQNLKYLGLVGLVSLMRSHPRSVVEHRELVLRCLNDDDVTIRTRALELLAGIVSRKSLVDLVHHLLEHVKQSEGTYRDEIIAKVLYMCSKEKYSLVTDFAWYTSVLLDLAVMQGSKHGKEVADQLIEIALRVDTVRPYAVEAMLSMLLNDNLILGQARVTVSEVLKAAAWIVGEYSDIVSSIAFDAADDDVEPRDDEDEEDDEGYWIEGPTGEDIRSAWRGQPVHLLVVSALLHPRATNLPAHAQAAYVQSAMKVFVRACADCEEQDITAIVGVIRSKLGVFLQSMSIEVQERASTLRHLIAELGVLSMTWEQELEEAKKSEAERIAGTRPANELLDVMAASTPQSVQGIDAAGASAAKVKKTVLETLISETFYAVHPKAQKRVPVPEGLDLDQAFNNSALNKLLAIDVPTNVVLANLTFTSVPAPVPAMDRHDDDDGRVSKLAQSWGDESSSAARDSQVSYSSFQGEHAPTHSGRNPNDSMFYLTSKSTTEDIMPLSQILAETFEDNRKGKKGKKDKGSKSKRSKGGIEIDTREMLPAGAVSSDEEDGGRGARKKKATKKTSTAGVAPRRGKGDDLEGVDLTTPLRPDEFLAVPKHRVVTSAPLPGGPRDDDSVAGASTGGASSGGTKDKKKKKGDKKEKGDKKKKGDKAGDAGDAAAKPAKSKAASTKPKVVDDLLGLDWSGAAPVPASAPAAPVMEAVTQGGEKKSKSKSKTSSAAAGAGGAGKKSSSAHGWLSCFTDRHVELFYTCAATSPTTVAVTFRASNHSEDGAVVTVDVSATSAGGTLRPAAAPNVRIATDISVGGDSQAGLDFTYDGSPIVDALPITCAVRVSVESLLGPDTTTGAATLKVTPCVNLAPHKVDEEGFIALMGKNSSRCVAASCKVPLHGKPKSGFKSIAGFLHAHTVQSESTKAASFCAKTVSGGFLCALAKISKDSTTMSIDLKAMCPSKPESQILVDGIHAALASLSL